MTIRDRLARQRQLYQLSTLPNSAGFEFYGFGLDGQQYNCVIVKDEKDFHTVGGEASFNEIIGWKEKPKEKK